LQAMTPSDKSELELRKRLRRRKPVSAPEGFTETCGSAGQVVAEPDRETMMAATQIFSVIGYRRICGCIFLRDAGYAIGGRGFKNGP
jgi:hypothetical protein